MPLRSLPAMDSARISPTAHYTGYVWARHGLSVPALATARGRVYYGAVSVANAALRAIGAATLDDMLLARHLVIDHLLAREIESGRVGQVIELAAGLSPRGARFSAAHPGCTYVEGDLPDMIADKRARLERGGSARPNLRVVPLDALAAGGPSSLEAVAGTLDPAIGTAVVTEGLLMYFDEATVRRLWARIAAVLARFPRGIYLSDLLGAGRPVLLARPFRLALSVFARGRVHFPFGDAGAATAALREAGFVDAEAPLAGSFAPELPVSSPARSAYVRVVSAHTPAK